MSIMYKEQVDFYYNCYLRSRAKTDVCWTWHHHKSITAVMDMRELILQIEVWNRDGSMKCNPKNNREVSDGEGRTYYCLTVQVVDDKGELDCDNNPMNPFHLMKFGIMVSGYTYYFEKFELRDCVCEAINKREKLQKYIIDIDDNIDDNIHKLKIKELKKQRDELNILIAEKAAEELLAESDGSVESEKSKKSNSSSEKSKTREANKNRDAKKKEKEDFIKHAAECARILAQQEAKKLALKKAKAKAQKK